MSSTLTRSSCALRTILVNPSTPFLKLYLLSLSIFFETASVAFAALRPNALALVSTTPNTVDTSFMDIPIFESPLTRSFAISGLDSLDIAAISSVSAFVRKIALPVASVYDCWNFINSSCVIPYVCANCCVCLICASKNAFAWSCPAPIARLNLNALSFTSSQYFAAPFISFTTPFHNDVKIEVFSFKALTEARASSILSLKRPDNTSACASDAFIFWVSF